MTQANFEYLRYVSYGKDVQAGVCPTVSRTAIVFPYYQAISAFIEMFMTKKDMSFLLENPKFQSTRNIFLEKYYFLKSMLLAYLSRRLTLSVYRMGLVTRLETTLCIMY